MMLTGIIVSPIAIVAVLRSMLQPGPCCGHRHQYQLIGISGYSPPKTATFAASEAVAVATKWTGPVKITLKNLEKLKLWKGNRCAIIFRHSTIGTWVGRAVSNAALSCPFTVLHVLRLKAAHYKHTGEIISLFVSTIVCLRESNCNQILAVLSHNHGGKGD